MRRYETQNTLLICREPIAKAFYPIPGRRLLCTLVLPEGDPMGDSGFFPRYRAALDTPPVEIYSHMIVHPCLLDKV